MRKTHEKFLSEVYDKVGNEYIIIGKYTHSKTKLEVRHEKCGFEFLMKPNSFLNGSRCPQCFGTPKKTTEEFKKEICELVGDEYSISSEYLGNKKKVKFLHSICKSEFWMSPNGFLIGYRCPQCSRKQATLKRTKTHEQFEKEFHKIMGDEYELLSTYVKSEQHVDVKHKICNHVYSVTPSKILSGRKCPKCARRITRTNEEFLKDVSNLVGNEYVVLDEIVLESKKIRFQHISCGHIFLATPSRFTADKQPIRCPRCAGKVADENNCLATVRSDLLLEWDYERNRIKPTEVLPYSEKSVYWICEKGHNWKAIIKSRSNGNGCPYCSNRRVLKGFNDLETINPALAKEWHPIKNEKHPFEVMSCSGKKYWWVCKNGHEWKSTLSNRAKGSSCPICSGHSLLKGFNDLATINPALAKEWHPDRNKKTPCNVRVGSHEQVWWRCSKGHDWRTAIKSRSSGNGCPICNESRGEREISKILNYYQISFIPQYRIDECKNKRALPFDFGIIVDNSLIGLIEYDGEQHFKAIKAFGGKSALNSVKKRDEIKTSYCLKNDIPLLRIPYWNFNNIKKLIIDFLVEINILEII